MLKTNSSAIFSIKRYGRFMSNSLEKKLRFDILIGAGSNLVINWWIAHYLTSIKTPPLAHASGIELFLDVLITVFLVGIIVFELTKRTVAGKLRKNVFGVYELSPCVGRLLQWGVCLVGNAWLVVGKILMFSFVPTVFVFAGFFLADASTLDPMPYGIFKGLLCAFVSVPATIFAFGAAIHDHDISHKDVN